MRKRFLLSVGLFGLVLSLIFGTAVFGVLYWVEDRSYRSQLEQLLKEGAPQSTVAHFSGPESELPNDLVTDVKALPSGLHEIERDDREIHVLITSPENQKDRQIAVIQIPETEALENTVLLSLGIAILITTLIGGFLGRILVLHTVHPIEALVDWLKEARSKRTPPPQSQFEEVQLLTSALDDYVTQKEVVLERELAFVREASHELRTPISIIRGVCELAEETTLTEETVARIRRSNMRMEHTVEGLLCLAREEQLIQGVDFQKEWNHLFDEMQERFGKQTALQTDLQHTPSDPMQGRMLILALSPLLQNALQHSEASKISVSLTKETLTVADNGKGIHSLPGIQKALTHLHPLPAGGLGLSLVERVCRRMNWTFRLENQSPGTRAIIEQDS